MLFQRTPKGLLYQGLWNVNDQQNRSIHKHWKPEYKWLRMKKFQKVKLPNFQEKHEELSEEEMKRKLKERGIPYARYTTFSPNLIRKSMDFQSQIIDGFFPLLFYCTLQTME